MKRSLLTLVLPLCLCVGIQTPLAEPSVEIDDMATITEGIDNNVESQLKKAKDLKKFVLEECGDADLAKLCAMFPNMEELQIIDAENIKNLAPLAGLKQLQSLNLDCAASDLSPLAGLTNLTTLNVEAAMTDLSWMHKLVHLTTITVSGEKLTSLAGLPTIPDFERIVFLGGAPKDLTPLVKAFPNLKAITLSNMSLPDLSPLGKLSQLEELDLNSSKVKDYSPLAACANLTKLCFYGNEGADFSTLGKLTQVSVLEGGLTGLSDISWISNLPNLKSFSMFSEPVADYSPLTKTHLETLSLWKMTKCGPVDLTPIGKITTLTELQLDEMEVTHFEALAALTNLQLIKVVDTKGAGDLAAIKKLPHLKKVVVDEECPEASLAGFGKNVTILRD